MRELSEKEKEIFASLQTIEGATVSPSQRNENSFTISFSEAEAIVTFSLLFFDYAGADIAIMRVMNVPRTKESELESERGKGHGTKTLQKILDWAKAENYSNIVASQVDTPAIKFWRKNGFVEESNGSGDWEYKP